MGFGIITLPSSSSPTTTTPPPALVWWGQCVWQVSPSDPLTPSSFTTLPDRINTLTVGHGLVAICTADKALSLYSLGNTPPHPITWKHHQQTILPKKVVQAVILNPSTILMADKFGDVNAWYVDRRVLRSLVGHVSLLTCLAISPEPHSFLVSADRDEKIRVSHYPHTFDISAYCMGLAEFTTCMTFLPPSFVKSHPSLADCFLSAGCDGQIHLWNARTGSKVIPSLDMATLLGDDTLLPPAPRIISHLVIRPVQNANGDESVIQLFVGMERGAMINRFTLSGDADALSWGVQPGLDLRPSCQAILAFDLDLAGEGVYTLCYSRLPPSSLPTGKDGKITTVDATTPEEERISLSMMYVDLKSNTPPLTIPLYETGTSTLVKNGSEEALPVHLQPWASLRKDEFSRHGSADTAGKENQAEIKATKKPFHAKKRKVVADKVEA